MSDKSLEGQVAIVTGSSTGIGQTTAMMLAKAGAHVVINSRTLARIEPVVEMIREAGGSASAAPADLLDMTQIAAMVDRTAKDHGRLDILVGSGAGATSVTLPWEFFHAMAPERFLPIVQSFWLSRAYLMRAALPHMIEGKYGKIVNISTDGGLVPTAGESLIGGGAAGLQQMTRVVAREAGRYGVRINTVCCGPLTDNPEDEVEGYIMNKEWIAASEGHKTTVNKLNSRRMFPVERADVARTVLYLVEETGNNITGQTWSVNGGISMPA